MLLRSAVLRGLEAQPVDVEIGMGHASYEGFEIVGLGRPAVKESRVRLKHALENSGFQWPDRLITINLAPADIPKEGTTLDLAIALAILMRSGQVRSSLENVYAIGELGLEGNLRPCRGALAVGQMVPVGSTLIAPMENRIELALLRYLKDVNKLYNPHVVSNLVEAVDVLSGRRSYPAKVKSEEITAAFQDGLDFGEIKGQQKAKRALEVAAAGGHNVLLVGPPGEGKSLLAKALPTILPLLTRPELVELTRIYSIRGELPSGNAVVKHRPFRAIHHTGSREAIVGGGSGFALPGEITMAHRGVLFMDELPEFGRGLLETLRQPLEDGMVRIPRKDGTATYPCEFILIAAMNPCPCGFYDEYLCEECKKRISERITTCPDCGGQVKSRCHCTDSEIKKYQSRISGPLYDRIDLTIKVSPLTPDERFSTQTGERSRDIRERVERARVMQRQRFEGTAIQVNGHIPGGQVDKFCELHPSARSAMREVAKRIPELSTRGHDKLLKVARTVADLKNSGLVYQKHIIDAADLCQRSDVAKFLSIQPEIISCPSCGAEVVGSSKFCNRCGRPILEGESGA